MDETRVGKKIFESKPENWNHIDIAGRCRE
jgi:hypothetical protein